MGTGRSGAAAAVLGRADEHPEGHRILGGVTRAATQFHELCVGSVDGMFTDAKALLRGGLELVVSAWKDAASDWNWTGMDRYITHQVSSVHTNAIVKAARLDRAKVLSEGETERLREGFLALDRALDGVVD